MTRSNRIAIAVGVVLVPVVASALYLGADHGCASRDEVAARVAGVASELQQAASQGKITIEQLADGIRRLNAAATAYDASQDHAAYCEAVDALRGELIAKH